MIKRTNLSTISSSLVWVSLFLLSPACGRKASVREVGPARVEAPPEKGHVGKATSAERFGFRAQPDQPKTTQAEPRPAYTLPKGWTLLPASQFVALKMKVPGHPDATCHLSILGGDGGGLLANVNRWRNQIGNAPTTAEEVAKLPLHKFFNSKAILLDLTGSYAGMSAGGGKQNWGLMGLMLVSDQASLLLKMQGPADLLQKEKQNFLDLAASFHWTREPALPAGHAPVEAGSGTGGTATSQPTAVAAKGGMAYDKPATWKAKPGSQYRTLNFDVGSDGITECYVSQSGGGLLPNLNRWRGQMGLKPMSTTELTRLSPLRVLGVETPLLVIEGSFQGMSGPRIEKAGMLAVYVETSGTSYAIKLTGPTDKVRAAQRDFVKFVQSLRMR